MIRIRPRKNPLPLCDVCGLAAGFGALRVNVPVGLIPVAVERVICRGCQPLLGRLMTEDTLTEIRARRPKPEPDYP